ncbi:protein translocase subunit SecF [Gemmobacter serpentinus]|uniref:protein translocase subunit SecF n=1 Tax=Gemmobacter serpentinus TaxID=2652247 RepID=UPI00124D7612|nr:protein translocase subunit SecF [Gemmobacter serpentinus]
MAFRLKLVPTHTNIDFFKWQWLTFGASVVAVVVSLLAVAIMGLNFGVDFKGGTTIRVESTQNIDISVYREATDALGLGEVSITDVFDPSFRPDQHVKMLRVAPQDGYEAVTPEVIEQIEAALLQVDPAVTFPSVESVGPKVSNELIWKALAAVAIASTGIWIYVWLRFEWQFAVGCVAALIHDVIVTVGFFAIFQLKFDLTIVAALLTILGYSVNDTVVIFDRLRENLPKYKQMPLRDLMNLTTNETLSRTVMTMTTTALALTALVIFGGDVIRGFVSAMLFGVFIGCYSTLYVAKNIVLMLGLDRTEKAKKERKPGDHEFANIDA